MTLQTSPARPFAAATETLFNGLIFTARRWRNAPRSVPPGQHAALVEQLRREGYVIIPNYYDDGRCDRMVAEIDHIMETQPEAVRRDALDADYRVFGIEHASAPAAEFHRDAFLHAAGEAYYGNRLVNFSTLAGRLRFQPSNSGSGHGWHRDAFHFQFKAMVYLTDVSPENGAFQILARSHRPFQVFRDTIHGRLAATPQSRITDVQADRLIAAAPARLRTVAAKRGTAILFDSSAIHRGSPIGSGIRYALTNYYFQPEQVTPRRYEEFAPFAQPSAE